MKKVLYTIAIAFQLASQAPLMAQGCSDAGFCTIGSLKQHDADSGARRQKLSLMLPFGIGDDDVAVITPGLQYDSRLNEKWSVQARLAANWASGALGDARGAGDIYISGTRHLVSRGHWQTSITLGLKAPLNSGNLKSGGLSLPMQYQSSLGTVDLIAGITVTDQTWQFSAGWQQPLSGSNGNEFLPAHWDDPEAANYPPSNDFNRKADILARASYLVHAGQKLRFSGGLLAIYHLAEDTYVNIDGEKVSYKGSQGLTLNATVTGHWNATANVTIGFSAGTPLVTRDVRPDGLTRTIVFAPEIAWRF